MAVTTELKWHLLSKEKPILKEKPGHPSDVFGITSEILVFIESSGAIHLGVAHKYVDEPDVQYVTTGGSYVTPKYWAELTTPFNT